MLLSPKKVVSDNVRREWLADLKQVNRLMEANEQLFNMSDDPDVTDYAIYEYNALIARYHALLHKIRAYDLQEETASTRVMI
ncbi:MAG: hypothetical protein RR135_05310 [Oscillospiraceae bacterium]